MPVYNSAGLTGASFHRSNISCLSDRSSWDQQNRVILESKEALGDWGARTERDLVSPSFGSSLGSSPRPAAGLGIGNGCTARMRPKISASSKVQQIIQRALEETNPDTIPLAAPDLLSPRSQAQQPRPSPREDMRTKQHVDNGGALTMSRSRFIVDSIPTGAHSTSSSWARHAGAGPMFSSQPSCP